MNSRILSIINTDAIFLAAVILAGTITLSIPSFTNPVNAQTEPYYYGEKENGYGSYEPEPREYPSQYQEREYNNYPSEYRMDSYEKKSYRDDNYEQPAEYPSYKEDYKQEYKSYEKNDYKSKDKDRDSNNISISKNNCNNVNYNVIGNVTGDNNIGNDGTATPYSNGALGANAYENNGEGYDDGYQKSKDVSCIISNNNTIITGGGNPTDDNGNVLSCEECFTEFLTEEQITAIIDLEGAVDDNLGELCLDLLAGKFNENFLESLVSVGVASDVAMNVIECLINAGATFEPAPDGLGDLPTAPSLGLP